MSGFFGWCMRRGAVILFIIALLQFAAGLLAPLSMLLAQTGEMARNHNYPSSGLGDMLAFQMVFSALLSAAFPFFGAVVIHRLDLWLGREEAAE